MELGTNDNEHWYIHANLMLESKISILIKRIQESSDN